MPLYEYECKKCHHRVERIQKFSDPHLKKCPDCGSPVELVVSAPAVQFKGSGWYVTDYAKKSSATASSSNGESSSKDESQSKSGSDSKGGSDSKSDGDSKGDSKSESKNDSDSKSKKDEKSKQDSSKKSEKKPSARDK
jgi:putative FmdB family regulatory protein